MHILCLRSISFFEKMAPLILCDQAELSAMMAGHPQQGWMGDPSRASRIFPEVKMTLEEEMSHLLLC